MLLPIGVLALGSLLVGLLGPMGWVDAYLGKTPHLTLAHGHGESSVIMLLSAIIALSGAIVAYYTTRGAGEASAESGFRRAGANRFYIDEIYSVLIVLPLQGLSSLLAWFDRYVVNGFFDVIATIPRAFGAALRQMQSGIVQSYALLMAVGFVILLMIMVQ